MFCQKCGIELPNDSNFCTNCGFSFKSNSQNQFNYSDVATTSKGFLKSLFLSPIKCCSEYSDKLSEKFSYVYFTVTTLIISLLCTLGLKSFIKSSLISFFKSMAELQGYSTSPSEVGEMSFFLEQLLSGILPFFKTFCAITLSFVVFWGSILFLSYIIHTLVFKVNIPLKKYFVVTSVALTLQGASLVIFMLLFSISSTIGLLFLVIANVLIIIVLYSGISNLKETNSNDPYIFSTVYAFVTLLTSYILIKLIASQISNQIFNGISGLSNFLSEIFSYF